MNGSLTKDEVLRIKLISTDNYCSRTVRYWTRLMLGASLVLVLTLLKWLTLTKTLSQDAVGVIERPAKCPGSRAAVC